MLKHYKGTSGYAYLYLTLFFSLALLVLIIAGLCQALGFSEVGKVAGGIIISSFWIFGFVITQRFLAVEKRRPTLSEANIISIKNVLFFIALLLGLALLFFVFKTVGSGGFGGESARGGPPEGKTPGDGKQKTRAIQMAWGMMATILLFYIAPLLNLAILSRFMRPDEPEKTS